MVVKSNQKLDGNSYHIRGHIFSGSSQDSQVNETDNDSSRNVHNTFQRESFRDGVFTSVSALFLHVLWATYLISSAVESYYEFSGV